MSITAATQTGIRVVQAVSVAVTLHTRAYVVLSVDTGQEMPQEFLRCCGHRRKVYF